MPKKSSTASSRRHWSSISEQSSDETPTGLTKTVHRVGVAADHGGFELMEQLVGKLRAAGHEVPVRSPSRRSPTSTPTFCPSTAWTRRKPFIRESHLCALLKEPWPSMPWLSWRSAGCGSEVEHPRPPGGGATLPRKSSKPSGAKWPTSNTSWRRWERGTRKTVLEALTLNHEPAAVPARVYQPGRLADTANQRTKELLC